MTLILSGTDGLSDVDGSAATPAIRGTDANTGIFFPAADTIAFAEGGAEVARFDSDGDFGIGTSSPVAKLNVIGTTSLGQAYAPATPSATIDCQTLINSGGVLGSNPTYTAAANTGGVLLNAYDFNNGSNYDMVANIIAMPQTWTGNGNGSLIRFLTASSSSASPTEAARIDKIGNLLMGGTTNLSNSKIDVKTSGLGGVAVTQQALGDYCFKAYAFNNAGTYYYFYFVSGSTFTGQITSNGTTTSYGTTSDYRLKDNVVPMTGALEKVALFKPVTYKWKSNGTDGQGFLAHELAEVVPDCVSGEKDGVDAEGNPQYQSVDTSFLVATLTAAIQEQQALIQSLTDRITALETAAVTPPVNEQPA
jgi:hypothetical protein